MWSSRLFWKLFLAYAGLILLVVCACVAIVSGWQEGQLVEQVRRRLHDSAAMLRDYVSENMPEGHDIALQEHLQKIGQETNTRFTVVASEGQVLADSDQPSLVEVAQMENHLGRLEFMEAAQAGEGFTRRVSPTLGTPFRTRSRVLHW